MRKWFRQLAGAAIAGGMLAAPAGVSAQPQLGSSLTVTVDDSPLGGSYTQAITVGNGTTTTLPDDLTLTQTIISTAPGVNWYLLDFEATDGKLLAGNTNAYWSLGGSYALASPEYITGGFFYWSVDGKATQPIRPFLDLTGIITDPLDPSVGQVYGGSNPISGSPLTQVTDQHTLFVTPYSAIAGGGMDLNAVNGFTFGIELTNPVPEPSSMVLVTMAAAVGGGVALIRRLRRRAD